MNAHKTASVKLAEEARRVAAEALANWNTSEDASVGDVFTALIRWAKAEREARLQS